MERPAQPGDGLFSIFSVEETVNFNHVCPDCTKRLLHWMSTEPGCFV